MALLHSITSSHLPPHTPPLSHPYPFSCLSPALHFRPSLANSLATHRSLFCRASHAPWTRRNNTVDYERSRNTPAPMSAWFEIFNAILATKDVEMGAESVLDEMEGKGRRISKWDLYRVVKTLRRYYNHRLALQVCEWMNERSDVYSSLSGEIAIQLDLIAKVHGVAAAEDYFLRIPNAKKDNRVYGAMLNAYAGAKMRDKAEELLDKARSLGYADSQLQFSVMMGLYMKLKDYDKVESLIMEMKQKNINLDFYCYNMWLSSRGSRGSIEGMEEVFKLMATDSRVTPHWTTYSIMAVIYIEVGQLGKAMECLENLESRIRWRERKPYHYLLSLYGSVGEKEEVYRVWDTYKSLFPTITNRAYKIMMSSLIRIGDEGAEKLYEEWLATKPAYDVGLANRFMNWHIDNGLFDKAKSYLYQMAEMGAMPNASTWDILAKGHARVGNISEALSCLKEAVLVSKSQSDWSPNPANIAALLELIERDADKSSKVILIDLLKQFSCWDDENYRSRLSSHGVIIVGEDVRLTDTDKSDVPVDVGTDDNRAEMEESEPLFSVI